MSVPAATAVKIATGIAIPLPTKILISIPESSSVEPTDRSSAPVMITKVRPVQTTISDAELEISMDRLPRLTNALLIAANTTKINAKMI